MKVHKLYVQFIKGIKEIQIYAKKSINEVAGPNESGKTTLLDAIKWAFGGKKLMDDKPVHNGKYEGSIILETDDGFTIRQRIHNNGKVKMSIKDKDGGIHGQSRLNDAFDKLSFDPLSFSNMKSKDRIELIQEFAGEAFMEKKEALQNQIDNVFETRRSDKRVLASMGELKPVEKVEPMNIDELMDEMRAIDAYNEDVRKRNDKRKLLNSYIVNQNEKREKILKAIQDLKADLDKLDREQRHTENQIEELGPEEVAKDRSGVDKALAEAADTNWQYEAYNHYIDMLKGRQGLERKIKTASDTLEYLKEALNDHVSSVNLPVEGLTFDGKDIFVYGIPWDQLSKSEKIRYSAHVGMFLHKELKVMFVYDGSLLDDERLKVLTDIVEEYDYQLWIETVGQARTENAIILEAGEVKDAKRGSLDDKEV